MRIIPARAGQTWRTGPRCRRWPDHPRACGANYLSDILSLALSGSSPRVRGKHGGMPFQPCERRIIPARAGQTTSSPTSPTTPPDHPRACGANLAGAGNARRTCGSSPRVRGKQALRRERLAKGRIIPARAGQTSRCTLTVASRPDHPRACGANGRVPEIAWTDDGSSPRVRGKRRRHSPLPSPVRIIPARAGQTQDQQGTMTDSPDHPRACGANGVRLSES